MKKSILAFRFSTLFFGAVLISCSTPSQKVEKAQEEVSEANKNLDKANQEYLADIQNYRVETDTKIAANNESLIEFRKRIEHAKKEAKIEYNKKIADLEQKNSDMKKRMDDYKEEGKENWEKFKAEFNRDMDELENAFKDLTVRNTK
jgi:hypothetical protein